jgi:hypothetical protein
MVTKLQYFDSKISTLLCYDSPTHTIIITKIYFEVVCELLRLWIIKFCFFLVFSLHYSWVFSFLYWHHLIWYVMILLLCNRNLKYHFIHVHMRACNQNQNVLSWENEKMICSPVNEMYLLVTLSRNPSKIHTRACSFTHKYTIQYMK